MVWTECNLLFGGRADGEAWKGENFEVISQLISSDQCRSKFSCNIWFFLQVSIKGYAVSGGGRGIERVDISMDGGKSWVEASRTQKPGKDYISEHNSSDKWAWVLFEATIDVSQSTTEVIAKAVKKLLSQIIIIVNYSRIIIMGIVG